MKVIELINLLKQYPKDDDVLLSVGKSTYNVCKTIPLSEKASGTTCIYADIGGDDTTTTDYKAKHNELKDEYESTIDSMDRSSKAMNDMRKIIDDERAKAEETIKELESLNEFYKNKVEFYKGQVEAYQYCMNCRR